MDWSQVVESAHALRGLLEGLKLQSFVKTTGGKGVHVVVPLVRRHTWDEVKDFSLAIVQRVARDAPQRFTVTMAKVRRPGRIFLDYLRNSRGATAVACRKQMPKLLRRNPLYHREFSSSTIAYARDKERRGHGIRLHHL